MSDNNKQFFRDIIKSFLDYSKARKEQIGFKHMNQEGAFEYWWINIGKDLQLPKATASGVETLEFLRRLHEGTTCPESCDVDELFHRLNIEADDDK